jgi:hypothetical protein
VTEQEAIELALETVRSELRGMVRGRVEIFRAAGNNAADSGLVHAFIKQMVTVLDIRLAELAENLLAQAGGRGSGGS